MFSVAFGSWTGWIVQYLRKPAWNKWRLSVLCRICAVRVLARVTEHEVCRSAVQLCCWGVRMWSQLSYCIRTYLNVWSAFVKWWDDVFFSHAWTYYVTDHGWMWCWLVCVCCLQAGWVQGWNQIACSRLWNKVDMKNENHVEENPIILKGHMQQSWKLHLSFVTFVTV